ncbi:MAG: hypothetical protein PHE84_03170 [bacterium]|nr:hypothetical protein [bacterium]
MTIKTLLILLSLISYPSVSGAEYLHLQKYSLMQEENILTSQANYDDYLKAQSQPSFKSLKPVSPVLAGVLASIPLTTTPIVFGIEMAVFGWRHGDHIRFPWITTLYGLTSFTFFTIPEHMYVHDGKSYLAGAKIGTLAASGLGYFIGWGMAMGCIDRDCGEQDYTLPIVFFSLGLASFFGIYLYELIDAPLAAMRYNKKIEKQQQGFFVLPYAYKDQYRVNVGYRF